MSSQFPPSSPIGLGAAALHDDQQLDDPFYQPSSNHSSGTLQFFKTKTKSGVDAEANTKTLHKPVAAVREYPTPNPSSTLGRSSSPARAANVSLTLSDFEFERELEDELTKPGKRAHAPVQIALDPRDSSRLAIGRKKSVCDIALPREKNISRQHAFISYIATTNQVRLECNGTNGLVVAFPKRLALELVKRVESMDVYELVAAADAAAAAAQVFSHQKQLVKERYLTSFVLLKGETVIMPYVEGTVVDFRQVEAVLSLQDTAHDEEDSQNDTETEDELAPLHIMSDDFEQNLHTPPKKLVQVHEQHKSPPTVQLKEPSLSPLPEFQSSAPPSPVNFSTSVEGAVEEQQVMSDLSPALHVTDQGSAAPVVKRCVALSTIDSSSNNSSTNDTSANTNTNTNTSVVLKSVPSITPHTSFLGNMPVTPKKAAKREPLQLLDTNKTPVSQLQEQRRRKLTTPSPKKNNKRKLKSKNVSEVSTRERLQQLQDKGVDVESLGNVLANHLAFSNVQQTPLGLLQHVNSTISTLSRPELRALLDAERCIGVIYRTGKDAAGKPLDEEYYYDLDGDSDRDRRQLVMSLKGGRTGLRSCRKVHKQYFWKKPAK